MKKIIVLSSLAFLSTLAFAETDMQKQIDDLKAQLEKLEKTQNSQEKQISKVNIQSAKDNIKFDVDFRTSIDALSYETASGEKFHNDALYSNRLWLGMGYAPTDEMIFKGQLAFNKAFGASAFEGTNPQRAYGFDAFDWVVNETLTDDSLKVREAYWLWMPTVGGLQTTLSVGRRPATNGSLINLRDDDKEQSPLGHVINMEFDGASASVKLDQIAQGMSFKFCLGRGLTNARSWANSSGMNYLDAGNTLDTSDMFGFIFVPYNDGQYSVKTTWYRGMNLPGTVSGGDMDPTNDYLETRGDMDGAAVSLMSNGIGDEINEFLDETVIFASFATSKSHPDSGKTMLGSEDSKNGYSYWIGTQMPNLTGGKFGVEFNHGSSNWRPFTYGEDTMIGSKIAARGNAYEAYWTQPIVADAFSMQVRYTRIDYDYTGSNAFFGDYSTPYAIDSNEAIGGGAVKTASDLRVYFRYRY
ncbi:MAG TPA: hypothetical protein CFH84_02115 [Sulfurimonas sp. UBA12504]|nr:MAG: hypothetical protein A2019_02830 [Sulfurimonas sp. GWF2_37_8]DAB30784.1 MAG TPA: hypothetical protein CFH84_02115 [Sulfurimonas sp. UBA12504]